MYEILKLNLPKSMFCFMKASSKAVDNSAAVMDTLLLD